MAIATGGALTYGRKSAVRSRNFALASVATVATGTFLFFRYGLQVGERTTRSPSENTTMIGEPDPEKQTDQAAIKAGRGPKHWFDPPKRK